MAVVQSFDWPNRRIFMAAAAWHPIDVYREHRAARRNSEEARKYDPLMEYQGNIAKGGGRFTPRFAVMRQGAKIVPADGAATPVTTITGEIITDDQSEFIDVAPLAVKPLVKYQPPEAEVVQVVTSGNQYSLEDIRDEVWRRDCDGGLDMRQLMNLVAAVLCGKATVEPDGTVRFRDVSDSKDRLVAQTDGKGNRMVVEYNVT